MLYTIAVILIVLWLLGLVTSYTIGGFIHILLVVAVIMILVRLIMPVFVRPIRVAVAPGTGATPKRILI